MGAGWVIVAGKNSMKNADDLHITRDNGVYAKQHRIIEAGFKTRAQARKAKHHYCSIYNLQRSDWLVNCEPEFIY